MKYDVIAIGAGPAGCVMATQLSGVPNRSVLPLETGPDLTTFEIPADR